MDISSTLESFKEKIEDAVTMVHSMDAEEKLKAVQYWNVVSERLQDIVNHSVEDLGAVAFQMEGEKLPDFIDASQLVALGMAPAFMTRYISENSDSSVPGRRTKAFKHVNGHLILTNSMGNIDLLQSTEVPHVTLEVNGGIGQEHVALEEVVMGAEETVEECLNKQVQETNSIHETERLPQNRTAEANEAVENENFDEEEEDDDNGNTVHLMITANSQPPPKNAVLQPTERGGARGKNGESGKEGGVRRLNFGCEYCERTFNTPSQLSSHLWTHTKPYTCTDCHARFSNRGNLIVHRRRHSGERPYNCPDCDASFSTKGNLKRHVNAHSGEKPWQCTQCGSRFTEKKSLKVHMRRHTGEKPYQCSVCLKNFSQTSILQSHMAMHLNQRTHLCNQCGKSFRQKSQLRLHEQRHAGLRKYQCSLCAYKFLTKGDMERHKRVHTGERPFACEECGKTFTRQQSLNEHMNRHLGLKPYKCKYCKKSFVEMSACYKHIKSHERSKPDTGNSKPKPVKDVQNNRRITASSEPENFSLVVQDFGPNMEVSQVHKGISSVVPGIATVVIQRIPKNLYSSKNLAVPDVQHVPDKKTANRTESEQNSNENIDFSDVNLLASTSAFQQ